MEYVAVGATYILIFREEICFGWFLLYVFPFAICDFMPDAFVVESRISAVQNQACTTELTKLFEAN